MIAERVLDDVGRSPYLVLRLFLSVRFNSQVFDPTLDVPMCSRGSDFFDYAESMGNRFN